MMRLPDTEKVPTLKDACALAGIGLSELVREMSTIAGTEIPKGSVQHYWEGKQKTKHIPISVGWVKEAFRVLQGRGVPEDYLYRMFGIPRDEDIAALRDEMRQLRESNQNLLEAVRRMEEAIHILVKTTTK